MGGMLAWVQGPTGKCVYSGYIHQCGVIVSILFMADTILGGLKSYNVGTTIIIISKLAHITYYIILLNTCDAVCARVCMCKENLRQTPSLRKILRVKHAHKTTKFTAFCAYMSASIRITDVRVYSCLYVCIYIKVLFGRVYKSRGFLVSLQREPRQDKSRTRACDSIQLASALYITLFQTRPSHKSAYEPLSSILMVTLTLLIDVLMISRSTVPRVSTI